VLQVKASLPRAGKKPNGKKSNAGAAAEVRVLVTVLMGFSFEHFGGPDQIDFAWQQKLVWGLLRLPRLKLLTLMTQR
jgi:hypothetical protein